MSEGTGLLRIARIVKSNGTEGELLVSFKAIDPEDIDVQRPVFIYRDGLPVPFFIEGISPRGKDKALLRLVGVRSLDDAEELAGADIMARADDYDFSEDTDGLSSLTGWTLYDQDGRKAGVISDFEDIPGHPCLYVDTESGQAMIPLHEDLILSADSSAMELTMKLPDGLY